MRSWCWMMQLALLWNGLLSLLCFHLKRKSYQKRIWRQEGVTLISQRSPFPGNKWCPLYLKHDSFNCFRICKGKVYIAFHKFKLSGGVTSRKKPLWKIVKCAKQVGSLECGFYVMKYMYEVLKSCSDEEDLEKVFRSPL